MNGLLTRIDAATIRMGIGVCALAAGRGSKWGSNGCPRAGCPAPGSGVPGAEGDR